MMSVEPGDIADVQDRIAGFWHERGDGYDARIRSALADEALREAWLATLRAALPPPSCDVLDVGAGTGFLSVLCAELGHRVVGIDLAEGMLVHARAKAAALTPTPLFRLGDAREPPFPPGSFDAVVSRALLWTLPDPDRAFTAWRRLLRPAGRLLLFDCLWFQEGLKNDDEARRQPWWKPFATHYTEPVRAALPLLEADSHAPLLALATTAGFPDARVRTLEEITRLERAAHEPNQEPRWTYYALEASRA